MGCGTSKENYKVGKKKLVIVSKEEALRRKQQNNEDEVIVSMPNLRIPVKKKHKQDDNSEDETQNDVNISPEDRDELANGI